MSEIETLGDHRGARLTKKEREARECPFGMVGVPNVNGQGGIDKKFPVVGERAICGPRCALYDRERDLNCEEQRREQTAAIIEAIKALKRE